MKKWAEDKQKYNAWVGTPNNSKGATPVRRFCATCGLVMCFLIACDSHKPQDAEEVEIKCVEPENTYTSGTGHYAGYEWAEEHSGATCDGPSTSFNEGCQEYEQQEAEYEECQTRGRSR